MRVLVVEDHSRIGGSIQEILLRNSYNVDWVQKLEDAAIAIQNAHYSLILLDVGLPDGSGIDFLKKIRRSGNKSAVLVMTARGGLNDRIDGLDGGADDYLVKPFALEELISRCRAILRRSIEFRSDPEFIGNIEFDISSAKFTVNDCDYSVPRRELTLFNALLQRRSKICSREYLENEIYSFDSDPTPNALEASISRLRSFLRSSGASVSIRTVRGIGYILDEEADERK